MPERANQTRQRRGVNIARHEIAPCQHTQHRLAHVEQHHHERGLEAERKHGVRRAGVARAAAADVHALFAAREQIGRVDAADQIGAQRQHNQSHSDSPLRFSPFYHVFRGS